MSMFIALLVVLGMVSLVFSGLVVYLALTTFTDVLLDEDDL